MRMHISDKHKLLKSTHLFRQNTVLPHVPTSIKCKHTKHLVWGARHSLSLTTLEYPTNKAPGQTAVCMVQKFRGSRDHWKGMLAKCPMLISKSGQEQHTEVTDESQKVYDTHVPCHSIPPCFQKPQRISVNHAELSARTCLRQLLMNQVSLTGIPKS